MRRSFFKMQPDSKKYFTQWAHDVWRNQFLFWAIIAGFVTVFPTLYIPVINHVVFKHTGISWEWAIVIIESILFVGGIESWKWAKRIFFRRQAKKQIGQGDLAHSMFAHYESAGNNTPQNEKVESSEDGSNANANANRDLEAGHAKTPSNQ